MKQVWKLFAQTLPFIWARLLINILFAVGSLILLAITVGIAYLLVKAFGGGGGITFLLILGFIGSVYGLYKLLGRYVLYLLKAAHIAVLLELMEQGSIPQGKGMLNYGKEQVKTMFGTTSVFFAVDQLVAASVKQIHRWLMRLGNLLQAIPGANAIIRLISLILGIALNYIDEAVLSRVMKQKKQSPDTSVWKSAADSVVLYAQAWKSMLLTAAATAVFSILLFVICFAIVLVPLQSLVYWLTGSSAFSAIAVIGALFVCYAVKNALFDPVATIAMIRSYHKATATLTPSMDLKEQLSSVSRKFRELVSRDGASPTPARNPAVQFPGSFQ